MVFTAKTERGLLFCLLLVLISLFRFFDFSEWLVYLQILFIVPILSLLLIQYKLEIHENHLVYKIVFIIWPLYKKTISPSQIIQIKFKRYGWTEKGAIIRRKGMNIRVVLFTPKKVYEELMNFADKNNVSYFKTKDYTILSASFASIA